MGQALREIDTIEGGCELVAEKPNTQPIKQPINNPDKWLSVGDLVELTGRTQQAVQKAVAARRWYGEELIVKTVAGTRGNGGKTYLVHVDKLPPEFKERWYARHGIKLHEKVDQETGEVRLVPEQAYQDDADFQENVKLAEWRMDLILPVTRLPKGSADRAALIKELAEVTHRFPNGERKAVTPQTLYNWVKAYESDGTYRLMRKRRSDTGAKRTGITRAWDGVFAPHIDETTQTHEGYIVTAVDLAENKITSHHWRRNLETTGDEVPALKQPARGLRKWLTR